MKKINLTIVVALISTLSWGQFLDDFNYVTGTNLTANGWTQLSAGSGPLTINSNGLSYPNSPSSAVGFGVNAAPGMQIVGRSGGLSINSGTAYMSFLINLSSAGTTTGGVNIAGIMSGSFPSPGVAARAFTRLSGSGFNFGVGKTGLTPVVYESTVRSLNTTYLVVLKYTFNVVNNTDDIVEMWVNPTLGATEPAALLTMGSGANDATAALFGPTINPRSGTAAPTFEIDAIRYGAAWTAVTPSNVALTVSAASLSFGTLPIGTTSPSQTFNLSGTNLTPSAGNISVNAPSAVYEISNDNVSWGSTTSIPYTGANLSATPVYVRFTPSVSGPAAPGSISLSGGNVSLTPTIALTGNGGKPFYSKPSGSLSTLSTWGDVTNGTGVAPADFITDYQIFIIANRTNYTLDADLQIFGVGSKIVVGDGTNPIKLILPSGFTITNPLDNKVDVSNNATVEVANKIFRNPGDFSKTPFPYFGIMANNSTVEYTWNDIADTVRIPAETFGNLKLVNGLKYFSSGFAFANGNLDIIDVQGVNGTGNGSASILVRGNVTMSNSFFDTDPIADANRMNLNLGGTGTQTISGGDFYIGQLRTQAVSSTVPAFALDIVLGNNTNIIMGTTTAGGFNLQQPTHNLSLNGNNLSMVNGASFLSTNQGTISGTSSSNILISKTVGTAPIGTVTFATGGQVLNNFNFNSSGVGSNNLTLNSPLTVNGSLSLNAGNIRIGNNTLTAAGTISGGAVVGHIVTNGIGALKINGVGTSSKTFPVGPSDTLLYHPATLSNSGTLDNFSVNVSSLAPNCGDAAASVTARWNITEQIIGGSNCTVALNYTGAATGANYTAGGAKVVDCSGVEPFYNNGSVTGTIATGTGFTTFSTFGITSDAILLPVSFINFSGSRVNNSNHLSWITANEQNKLGFDVERSLDGQNFTTISFVNSLASGGSTINITYSFIDDKVFTGEVQYYRLRQIDRNNNSKYSAIVTIQGKKFAVLTIEGISPNPVQSNLVASISSPAKHLVNLQVLDMMGRILQQQQVTILEGNNAIPVNVSSLGSGIYFLKANYVQTNQKSTFKFIKQ